MTAVRSAEVGDESLAARLASRTEQPLSGVIVLEFAHSLATDFAGAMLADFGALVIKVEDAGSGGDPMRRLGPALPGEDSLYYLTESRNKLSLSLDLATDIDRVRALAARADALIEDLGPGGLDALGMVPADLQTANPALCLLRLSPFGLTGPRSTEPGDDRIAQAYSGMMNVTGFPAGRPMPVSIPLAEYWTGLHGANGLLIALEHARRTGYGQEIDLAQYETALRIQEELVIQYDQLGIVRTRMGNEYAETVPSNHYPTSDGKWVAISAAGVQPFIRVCEAMGVPEAAHDPRFSTPDARLAFRDDVNELIAAWTIQHDAGTVVDTFSRHGAPAAIVQSVDEIIADAQVRARRDLVRALSQSQSTLLLPARFPKLSGSTDLPTETAPLLGQHNDLLPDLLDQLVPSGRTPRAVEFGSAGQDHPGALGHLRVLDIGRFIAGPFAATLMGEFGAEIIKLELPSGDSTRTRHPIKDGIALSFVITNRNKRSMTLDLHDHEGKQLFLELLRHCDVLVENFRPGTLERWGLGPDELLAANPRLIVLRASGFGQNGPYGDRSAFDRIGLAAGGISYLGGAAGGPPLRPGVLASDYSTALFGLFGVLAAVAERARTGRGQVVDSTLYESILRMSGDVVALRSAGDIRRERDDGIWPLYPFVTTGITSDGVDVVVSAGPDADTASQAIRKLLADAPDRALEPREFRELVREWIGTNTFAEATAAAAGLSVTLQRINTAVELAGDEHLWARGSLIRVDLDVLGPVTMQGPVPSLSLTPGAVAPAPPSAGSDNTYVYEELLGIDAERVAGLRERGVI